MHQTEQHIVHDELVKTLHKKASTVVEPFTDSHANSDNVYVYLRQTVEAVLVKLSLLDLSRKYNTFTSNFLHVHLQLHSKIHTICTYL